MKSVVQGVGIGLVIFGVIFLLASLLIGCIPPDKDLSTCKFHSSEMVRSVISGHTGQVIEVRTTIHACYYDVRFAANQENTNTHILGSDGPITRAPLATVRWMREYELEEVS